MRKKEVLRGKKDFSTVYKKGKSIRERYIVVICLRNQLPYNRTGFLASKKVGGAVQRNRAKRLMKESYRAVEDELKIGYDLIFIARNTINGRKCEEVSKSLRKSMLKAHLIEE